MFKTKILLNVHVRGWLPNYMIASSSQPAYILHLLAVIDLDGHNFTAGVVWLGLHELASSRNKISQREQSGWVTLLLWEYC